MTGSSGSAEIKRKYPATDGLVAGTTTQEGHEENLKAKELTTLSCNNHIKNNLTEVMKFLKSESSSISPAANRETMVRNCRQSLEAEGKWENLATILQKFHGSFNFHLVNVNIQISSSHQ